MTRNLVTQSLGRYFKRLFLSVLSVLYCINGYSQLSNIDLSSSLENPFLYSSNQNEESLQYEREITNRLKKYIEPGKFLVIVDIKEHILPNDRSQPKSMNLDTGISVEFLPGLPFNPKIRRGVELDIPIVPKKTYKHFVNVLLDTSLSPNIIPFAERLLLGSGLFNDRQGDELIIEFMEFPADGKIKWDRGGSSLGNSTADELNNQSENDQLVRKLEEAIDRKLGAGSDVNPNDETSIETKFGLMEWIFIIGILTMIVLTVITMLQGKKSNEQLRNQMHLGAEMQSNQIKSSLDKLQQIFGGAGTLNTINSNQKKVEDTDVKSEVLNDDLSNDVNRIFLEDIDTVMDNIKEVLNGDNETLKKDIALAIAVANPAMMGYLKPILREEQYYDLENEVLKSRYVPADQKNLALKSFRDSYIIYRTNNVKKKKANRGGDIFQFLKQLNNKQLFQLIKDESEDMSAILLAQLPADQSVDVLSNFDIPKQTILLQRMSNINNVSTEMYKDVANKFSKKAMSILDLGDVAVDGLTSILNILETLPTHKQESYIQDIAKYDLDLARKIKEYFLTFDGLLEVDNVKLGRALGEVPNPVIAKALIGSNNELLTHILSLKTQREREVIESEMAVNTTLSAEELEANRIQMLAIIKDQIKR
jgi:flagellar motor switch protein FliG